MGWSGELAERGETLLRVVIYGYGGHYELSNASVVLHPLYRLPTPLRKNFSDGYLSTFSTSAQGTTAMSSWKTDLDNRNYPIREDMRLQQPFWKRTARYPSFPTDERSRLTAGSFALERSAIQPFRPVWASFPSVEGQR